jgi:hypothetical protein
MSKFQRVIAARWVKSLWLVALLLALTLGQRAGHAAEMRFALVIGNDEYKSTKLATPANDAGLVANALTAAGFTVTGARNLDQATLRESIREFLGQVAAAGPDAVAVIYLAGFGVQFAGENYYVPVDADLAREADLPLQAVRISDFAQPLAALPARVKIVILDAARQNPFAQGGEPLASGCPRHGDRVQRRSGYDRAGGARPVRRLCDGAHGNDRRRRTPLGRCVGARTVACERSDQRRRSPLVRIADQYPVLFHRTLG